jgi:hypothetical protein
MSLRMIPNLDVYRPADVIETAECWALALETAATPSVLALSRQNLPQLRTDEGGINRSAKGAYRLRAATAARKVVLLATGSEVEIALKAPCRSLKRRASAPMWFACRAGSCLTRRTRPTRQISCRRCAEVLDRGGRHARLAALYGLRRAEFRHRRLRRVRPG